MGITVEEAAHRGGLHWRHWQKVEAGEVNVTLETLALLADALQASISDLVRRAPSPQDGNASTSRRIGR